MINSTNLVDDLRYHRFHSWTEAMEIAADEIERLRNENSRLRQVHNDYKDGKMASVCVACGAKDNQPCLLKSGYPCMRTI